MINKATEEVSLLLNNVERLKQNNFLLRAILESPLGMNIFSLDRKYIYTFFTESHKQTIRAIWGVDIKVGMNMLDIIMIPEDREKAKTNFDKVLQGESLIIEEDYGDSKLLRSYWENRYNPIYDDTNKIIGLTVFVADISVRKRTEVALKESESRLRSYFELPHVGITVTSQTKGWLEVNSEICNMLGYSKEELSSLTWADLTHPQDLNADVEQFNRVMAGEIETYSLEKRFIRKNGEILWTDLSVSCVRKDDGSIDYMVALLQNITKRKEAEDALRESEEKYRKLTENMKDVVWVLDTETMYFTYISPSVEELRGYTVEEIMAEPVDAALTTKAGEGLKASIREEAERMLAGKKSSEDFFLNEIEQPCKDGSTVWTEVLTKYLLNKETGRVEVHGVTRNISKRKNAEQALLESEKSLRELNATKDKFFSIIAHDLRSPFTSIIGFSNLLADQAKDKDYEEVRKYAEIIQSSSKRVMDLLINLLEWSGSQTGRMEHNPEYVELVSLINEVTELSVDMAQHKSISIIKTLPRIAPVQADKAMISAIMRNLISNAIKYSYPGGTIIISAEEQEKELIISISDNGTGIEEKNIPKLFRIDRNFTTQGTLKEKGTGLGLILCKEFAEAHGGEIRVESEKGKGSKFIFTIPVNS
ncbi:MAG: PAS domain S-box protein [Ignavibacteriae bacterium]|nr:PAS domain S-box protein [Ignavibacteriota bacterium]